jgi:hypothetical protein
METTFRTSMSNLMKEAWTLVKVYGMTISEAMKKAWTLFKLNKNLHKGIVKFFYQKLDGTVRTAWGTLKSELIPFTSSAANRKHNDTVLCYYDTEKASFRSFKKANILSI